MKSALTGAAWTGLAVCTGIFPAWGQLQDNYEKQLTCENNGSDGDQVRHCEMREQTMPSIGSLTVDAGRNGGANIKGWSRAEVLVRARIEAQGNTESAAASVAGQVAIEGSGGLVRATGPEPRDNSWWSVSYEIFVPQNSNLSLKTYNGGLKVSDVRGQIRFDVNNGGVHLTRVAGDVSGATVNGGVQVELAGSTWDGRQLEVSTRNGGVTLSMPANYSAHVQAETGSGGIQSDFPLALDGNPRPRKVDANLGSGGPLIHVTTGNGSVHLKHAETQ